MVFTNELLDLEWIHTLVSLRRRYGKMQSGSNVTPVGVSVSQIKISVCEEGVASVLGPPSVITVWAQPCPPYRSTNEHVYIYKLAKYRNGVAIVRHRAKHTVGYLTLDG